MSDNKTDISVTERDRQTRSSSPSDQTIYQQKLERDSKRKFNSKLTYTLSIALIFLLLIVVFVLPSKVNDLREQNTVDQFREDIENDNTEAASIIAKQPIAQALLLELLSKIEDLEVTGVRFWGGDEWNNALLLQQDGEDAYAAGKFDVALKNYRESMQLLADLEMSIPRRLSEALESGQLALIEGNKKTAMEKFEIALAIDGTNQEAKRGYKRTLRLDQVIEFMKQGNKLQSEANWEGAILAYENALAIDAEWPDALEGVEISRQAFNEKQFQMYLSLGYQLMSDNKFDEAQRAFDKSFEIDPESKDIFQAIEELKLNRRIFMIQSLEYQALMAQVNEQWSEAKEFYKDILDLDPNINQAKESLSIVNERIDLSSSLIFFTANADNLNDDKLLKQAKEVLIKANRVEKKGPILLKQIDDLSKALIIAETLVDVTIMSDQFTVVTIYKMGELGSFERKQISLRPGIYKAIGTRPGYRDVSLKFKVINQKSGQEFIVQCKEKI